MVRKKLNRLDFLTCYIVHVYENYGVQENIFASINVSKLVIMLILSKQNMNIKHHNINSHRLSCRAQEENSSKENNL